jgi:hypothetical protein
LEDVWLAADATYATAAAYAAADAAAYAAADAAAAATCAAADAAAYAAADAAADARSRSLAGSADIVRAYYPRAPRLGGKSMPTKARAVLGRTT